MTPTKPIEASELEAHISDSERLMLAAYARFQASGNPADRTEAMEHLQRMSAAILSRSPADQAARHAAFEREIDEGVGYFSSAHARQLGLKASGGA